MLYSGTKYCRPQPSLPQSCGVYVKSCKWALCVTRLKGKFADFKSHFLYKWKHVLSSSYKDGQQVTKVGPVP